MKSKFIVIEGLEGAGKTTAREAVVEVLQQHGIHDIVFTREPGGTPVGEALREILCMGGRRSSRSLFAGVPGRRP